jgi:hypothetical protein
MNLNPLNNHKEKIHMKSTHLTFAYFAATAFLMLYGTDLFAVSNSADKGLNTSVVNLVIILDHNLVPIILLCGCLAGAALSYMKSSPAPFIIALITTVSFGFARSWINGTYAVLA